MPKHAAARVLGAVLMAGLLTGCATSAPEPRSESTPNVVMPGAPGDEPRVASGAERERLRQSPKPNEQEISYVRMMIPHHQQALEMTALAPRRALHPQVRALAERIGAAQGPEIEAMRGWLFTRAPGSQAERPHQHGNGEHGNGHRGNSEHGSGEHARMPGMATPDQLAELRGLRGAEFDRLFLRLMISHHEGAVSMATELLEHARDEQVHAMAQDVLVTQNDEIGVMRGLLGEV